MAGGGRGGPGTGPVLQVGIVVLVLVEVEVEVLLHLAEDAFTLPKLEGAIGSAVSSSVVVIAVAVVILRSQGIRLREIIVPSDPPRRKFPPAVSPLSPEEVAQGDPRVLRSSQA